MIYWNLEILVITCDYNRENLYLAFTSYTLTDKSQR